MSAVFFSSAVTIALAVSFDGSSRVAMAFLFKAVAEALGIALNAAISGPISEVVQRGTGLLAAGGRLVPC
jgi:hypothetical protein